MDERTLDEMRLAYGSHADMQVMLREYDRLTEQLRIAAEALEHIVQIANRGIDGPRIGVYAHDAQIRMSVVE